MKTDSKTDERCPDCGGPVLPVLYGMPDDEGMAASVRGELILGGCTVDSVAARCQCGVTVLHDGEWFGDFGVDDARKYIAEVRWQFAKTMPQWPHEYTVLRWQPEFEDEFRAFVTLIRSDGVVKPWPADSPTPRYHHTYLAIDGWDYWTMDPNIDDVELINRARLDDW